MSLGAAIRVKPSMDGLEPVSDPRLARLNTIPNAPGDPGYRSKLPKPDGPGIGEEPLDLDMAKLAETDGETHDKILGLLAASSPTPGPELPSQMVGLAPMVAQAQRAAVYCGRGESFVLALEVAPDWDAEQTWKYDGRVLLEIVDVLKAFGVKLQDKTGGELNELREHAPSRTKAAASPGAGAEGEGKPAERTPAAKRSSGRVKH